MSLKLLDRKEFIKKSNPLIRYIVSLSDFLSENEKYTHIFFYDYYRLI